MVRDSLVSRDGRTFTVKIQFKEKKREMEQESTEYKTMYLIDLDFSNDCDTIAGNYNSGASVNNIAKPVLR